MSRSVAVSLVFVLTSVLLLLSLLIVIPLLERQIGELIANLPRYLGWLKTTALPWLEQRTGLAIAAYFDPDQLLTLLKGHWQHIGRASCRIRVCQYIWISVVPVSIKKKKSQ